MYKMSIIIGTRPEAIKMAPVFLQLKKSKFIQPQLIVVQQQKDLVEATLQEFGITADVVLPIQREFGDINEFNLQLTNQLYSFSKKDNRPDLVLVHGDTSTAYFSSLFCFQSGILIAHIEAGLRSGCIHSPFPEEFYRRSISQMAAYHFVPDDSSAENLAKEGIEKNVFVVGNTISESISCQLNGIEQSKLNSHVIFTCHRRENLKKIDSYIQVLVDSALRHPGIEFIYPIHPNPIIQKSLDCLSAIPANLKLVPPYTHKKMITMIYSSIFVVTDSGGIQEEVSYLNIPSLILRDNSERGLGHADTTLVGSNYQLLSEKIDYLLQNQKYQDRDLSFKNDCVSEKIISILEGGMHEAS